MLKSISASIKNYISVRFKVEQGISMARSGELHDIRLT